MAERARETCCSRAKAAPAAEREAASRWSAAQIRSACQTTAPPSAAVAAARARGRTVERSEADMPVALYARRAPDRHGSPVHSSVVPRRGRRLAGVQRLREDRSAAGRRRAEGAARRAWPGGTAGAMTAGMERLIEVVAARLLEGSLVPLLGASLRRAVPHPPGPAAQAAWLAAMDEEVFLAGPAQAARAGDLPWVAGLLERRRGRRALQRLLREAYPPAPPPAPLHLLLASLPRLPLAISASLDGALLGLLRGEALEGARTLGLVHGVSPADSNTSIGRSRLPPALMMYSPIWRTSATSE